MIGELEAVALRLFADRGFQNVTVDDIVVEAHTSARTFYRYFPAKEDVLQVQIERRSAALQAALEDRPTDETPLQSVRAAFAAVLAAEDADLVRRWIGVVAAGPNLVTGVLGGLQLKLQPVLIRFIGARLGLPDDDYVPIVLAASIGGAIQAAHTRWFYQGGDVTRTVTAALDVLEQGIGARLTSEPTAATTHRSTRRRTTTKAR
jgi:AcrR family transcriptional regulator